ncbi:MAG: hypothetical protein IT457_15040 [Planctomycetes bacterium]|nr:hypothetical protein [Planctomycetota bacterium]
MTSLRKRKKTAAALGLSDAELTLAELLDEVLEELRWVRILAYGNQYLLNRHVKLDAAERDRVLEAATRAVEKDGKLVEWRERLAQVRAGALHVHRAMARARKDQAQDQRSAAAGAEGARDG